MTRVALCLAALLVLAGCSTGSGHCPNLILIWECAT
jgi:hypothetical protein